MLVHVRLTDIDLLREKVHLIVGKKKTKIEYIPATIRDSLYGHVGSVCKRILNGDKDNIDRMDFWQKRTYSAPALGRAIKWREKFLVYTYIYKYIYYIKRVRKFWRECVLRCMIDEN